MGAHLRETILALPALEWDAEQYMALFDQLDEEGHDERTRVRELLGIAAAKGTALHTLRVGELKAMLALAAGELDTALDLIDWTMEFNQSVFPIVPTTTVPCAPASSCSWMRIATPSSTAPCSPACMANRRWHRPGPTPAVKRASTGWKLPTCPSASSRCIRSCWQPMRSCRRPNEPIHGVDVVVCEGALMAPFALWSSERRFVIQR